MILLYNLKNNKIKVPTNYKRKWGRENGENADVRAYALLNESVFKFV